MAEGINLLPQITEEEIKKKASKRKANAFAILSLLALGGVLLALFAYQLFLIGSIERTETESKAVEDEILSKADVEVRRRLIVDKLDKLKRFVEGSYAYSNAFSTLSGYVVGSGARGVSFEFKDTGELIVTGESRAMSGVSRFIDSMLSEEGQTLFGQADLVQFTKKNDRTNNFFSYTIDMNYLRKGLFPPEEESEDSE